jgi:hypothetical protein
LIYLRFLSRGGTLTVSIPTKEKHTKVYLCLILNLEKIAAKMKVGIYLVLDVDSMLKFKWGNFLASGYPVCRAPG